MLVVEDGTGLADAESFASVAMADAYWDGRGAPAAWAPLITWSALDDATKEASLRLGTDYLSRYTGRWKGARSTGAQALDWPRTGVSVDGQALAGNAVPVQIQRAVCELALRAAAGPLMADETAQVKSEKVGPLEVTYADGARQQTRYATVEAMLAPLLSGSGSIRVTRS